MFGKMFVRKSKQPIPPREFWRAVWLVTNEGFANCEGFHRSPSTRGVWDIAFLDAVDVVDRYLNHAIESGWLD